MSEDFLSDLDRYLQNASPREAHALMSKAQALLKRHMADKVGDREQHLTWTIANEAYTIILEENLGAKDALIKAATNHTAEVESVLAEKSRASNKMNRGIVKSNSKHPIQQDMTKSGHLYKQGLNNTQNVWQMLNLLNRFREAYGQARRLEKVESEVVELQVQVTLAREEIRMLQQQTGNSAISNKEKAKLLKEKNFKQVEVAKALGVDKSTVNRWWASL